MNMNFKKIIIAVFLITGFAGINISIAADSQMPVENLAAKQIVIDKNQYPEVNPLDVVASPVRYLNRNISVKAKFDKFSTLGLDYEPALRSSEDYITFLILRNDVGNHSIPLSEMKIFMKRTEAEKFIDINSGDEIEFCGKVFSTALGDVWIDANKFIILNKKDSDVKN